MTKEQTDFEYFKAYIGEDIRNACDRMVCATRDLGRKHMMDFNGEKLLCMKGTTVDELVGEYHERCLVQQKAYEQTEEYSESLRRKDEFRKQARKAKEEGILPFRLSDEMGWRETVENNQDGYGACGIRYAARWAHLMEQELSRGKTVSEVADKCSYEADLEGITGFLHGCARSILCQVWEHGQELRACTEDNR